MADSDVEIYTLMIKRVVHAMRNLRAGLDHIETFYTNHSLGPKLNVPANLPTGFVKADYDQGKTINTQIDTFLTNNHAWGVKFNSFDGSGLLDPLDVLGKKFWRVGGPGDAP